MNDKLVEFIKTTNGTFRTQDATDKGVTKPTLGIAVKSGLLERTLHGIYLVPEAFEDDMYINQLRKTKIVYSHATALYLHGLTTRDPLVYDVTVPAGYNTKTLKMAGYSVHSQKKSLYELGITSIQSMYGNFLKLYDVERTLCDMVRDKKNQDRFVLIEGFKEYARSDQKDLSKLTKYSHTFNVADTVRNYMEVLL